MKSFKTLALGLLIIAGIVFVMTRADAASTKAKISSAKNTKAGITLKIKCSSKKVTGYQVFRSEAGKKYEAFDYTLEKEYVDDTADTGVTYRYKVRAYKVKATGKVKYYKKSAATKKIVASPIAPSSVYQQKTNGTIKVTWAGVDTASGYRVYRSTNKKKYTEIAVVGKTSFTDTDIATGTTYTYKIKTFETINKEEYKSTYSAVSIDYSKYHKHKINIDTKLLHPKLQKKLKTALNNCKKNGYFLIITEGYRTKKRQDYLYSLGRTRKGNIVTYAKGKSYSSQHQWGIAFDIAINGPAKDQYNNAKLKAVSKIIKKVGLGWGGDWKGLYDTPHYYLKNWGDTPKLLKKKYKTPANFKKTWK